MAGMVSSPYPLQSYKRAIDTLPTDSNWLKVTGLNSIGPGQLKHLLLYTPPYPIPTMCRCSLEAPF